MTATSPTTPHRSAIRAVGWRFVALYALAYMSTCLLFLAPLLVSLALKVSSLVGIEQAPNSLALVAGVGAAVAMFTNPFCGKLSDRTSSPLGMRRPWISASSSTAGSTPSRRSTWQRAPRAAARWRAAEI